MELEHRFSVPMGIDEAWAAFNDLERIAHCFPGAEITSVAGDDFTGTAKVKLGPISLQYTGTGRWVERDGEGYRAVIHATGKDRRGNGTAGATIRAHLEGDGSGTSVVLNTDLKITGRPAQFGRGVIQDVGAKLLDQFADCLTTTLAGRGLSGEGPAVPSGEEQRAEQEEAVEEQAAVAGQQQSSGEPAAAPGQESAAEPAAISGQQESGPERAAGAGLRDSVAEQAAVAGQRPAGEASSGAVAPPARPAPSELDLGPVVGPVLLRQYAPTLVAVVVTAVITWVVARRGGRSR